jgi:hypothetical protein
MIFGIADKQPFQGINFDFEKNDATATAPGI